ncbi:hypothetical protein [Vibrio sp. 99-70-13A1]|uniref:hypothetical protein n=1 Tax=Vibrio sp. 99-70-13A1 TaxID=2607601 RepID=UPI001493486D|nr:hypothetical protein [Vibrio sp. 99-70-13A1]NOH99449.1 hypothetical protein [Vibrio sp. 99-70-13A1]
MKFVVPLTLISTLLLSSTGYSATKIDSKNAPFHVGEDVIACGILKEVSRFKRGVYLNMDNRFPKQSVTFVVWEDDLSTFRQEHGAFQSLTGQRICGKGIVNEYKGRSQISLYNAFSLKLSN